MNRLFSAAAISFLAMTANASTPVTSVSISSPTVCQGTTITASFTEVPGDEITSWQWTLDGAPLPAGFDADPGDMTLLAGARGSFGVEAQTATGSTIYAFPIYIDRPDVSTTVVGTNSFCEGGSSTIQLKAVTTSFVYEWDRAGVGAIGSGPSITVTESGSYSVTATDPSTGCSRTSISRVFTVKPFPSADISYTGAPCVGSTLTAPAVPGNKYTWYLDGNPLPMRRASIKVHDAGAYTVVVNDHGCETTSPQTVFVNPVPNPVIEGESSYCAGSGGFLFSPGIMDSYQWKLNGVPLPGEINSYLLTGSPGKYSVEATQWGCSAISPAFKVKEVKNITARLIAVGGRTNLSEGPVELIANAGNGYTYQFYRDGSYYGSATATRNIEIAEEGWYNVEITKNGYCTGVSDFITVIGSTGSFRLAAPSASVAPVAAAQIAVYPNPSSGIYHIDAEGPVHAIVRDMQGRVIIDQQATSDIDITAQAPGLYLLQIADEDGKPVYTGKLVKQ